MEATQRQAERSPIRAGLLALAVAALLSGVAAAPARADRDNWHRGHEWHGHDWRKHEWREHEWREHEWRERFWRPGYGWGYPTYGYAPPPAFYSLPPPYNVSPPPIGGLDFVFPLR